MICLTKIPGFDARERNLSPKNTYTTIRRYFMVSGCWDFNKMGGVTKKYIMKKLHWSP